MEPTTQRTPSPPPPLAVFTAPTLFSPLKRKRESLPPPSVPSATQQDDEEEKEDGEGREPSGPPRSPRSGKLVRQLEGLSLDRVKFPITMEGAIDDEEEEEADKPVIGKRTRLVSPPLTLARDGSSSSDEEPTPPSQAQEEEEDSDWGLSGVGVKPSARQSYIRAQKKLQQIREYKSRVSKEAREKRSWERRRRRSFTNGNTATAVTPATGRKKGVMHRSEGEEDDEDGDGEEEGCRGRRKRVHFDV
ncbi:hypothetical protein L873DRAFT_935095 [Choiromyces venosus 120613-1]|uniref:Uncharacterized protein n=1 Tax=Choiromyces venosus 120613-1 TaxID=1336337 RepID=A0A3N4JPP8_9PEZI|nr:hypothetical protein L873DRAFT_935095 [Choiromyces venosus 120613-1]